MFKTEQFANSRKSCEFVTSLPCLVIFVTVGNMRLRIVDWSHMWFFSRERPCKIMSQGGVGTLPNYSDVSAKGPD